MTTQQILQHLSALLVDDRAAVIQPNRDIQEYAPYHDPVAMAQWYQ